MPAKLVTFRYVHDSTKRLANKTSSMCLYYFMTGPAGTAPASTNPLCTHHSQDPRIDPKEDHSRIRQQHFFQFKYISPSVGIWSLEDNKIMLFMYFIKFNNKFVCFIELYCFEGKRDGCVRPTASKYGYCNLHVNKSHSKAYYQRKKLDKIFQNGQTPEALKEALDKIKISDTVKCWP
ncbi:hypothetical protein RhiirC2_705753 [Rhizophagus irregularis]|uniref:Uncharacterized protein n=1 Tax=Rhizophagus irregularis TaxID=588596 RepID=A0A2N1NXA3_9GLOM|nr:hypothetical protein RhiirC2_705753 [Rhizophagus irregularis]